MLNGFKQSGISSWPAWVDSRRLGALATTINVLKVLFGAIAKSGILEFRLDC
ncbi:hypothetical protein [Picosynechococcus sp. PCC 7003]|uniref:hypothetical protein n=1 Tax=Picosynechococcus sp. PCC 7003 TaxID=374981 RepID=UPI0012EE143F|nr:hypothetical protein [Picosynechococcus sp. PCC 7003]